MTGEQWRVRRESDLGPDDHDRLAAMLRAAFPDHVHAFPERRSWSGARPELRVVAEDADGPVAHAGALRRFVQVGDVEQLVAVVGLVAVRPDRQGRGIGRQLGGRLRAALGDLAVPFGLLGCAADRTDFYRAAGWRSLPPTPTTYSPIDVEDPSRIVSSDEGWMLLPVSEAIASWPSGPVRWNGSMI